jgi:hypothetical protein
MVIVPYGFIEMASAVVRHEENPVVARRKIFLTLLAGIDGYSKCLLNNAMYLNGPGRHSLLSNIYQQPAAGEIAGLEAKSEVVVSIGASSDRVRHSAWAFDLREAVIEHIELAFRFDEARRPNFRRPNPESRVRTGLPAGGSRFELPLINPARRC